MKLFGLHILTSNTLDKLHKENTVERVILGAPEVVTLYRAEAYHEYDDWEDREKSRTYHRTCEEAFAYGKPFRYNHVTEVTALKAGDEYLLAPEGLKSIKLYKKPKFGKGAPK